MKVTTRTRFVHLFVRAGLALLIAAPALLSAPASAQAITRDQVLTRGRSWVAKKVSYSQSRYYRGYRRDCSGFVSMAWKLGRSYTTRSISSRARRIRISSLKPGDAVLVPGHVSLFVRWKNKRKGTYVAMEQTTWGSHAKRRVRKIRRHAKALRLTSIRNPRLRVATVPKTPTTTTPTAVTENPTAVTASAIALSLALDDLAVAVDTRSEGTCQVAEVPNIALALN